MNSESNHEWQYNLAEHGWALFSRKAISVNYLKVREIGEILGTPCIQVKYLVPKAHDAARPNTLSSMFGLSSFPIHTDFSTRAIPARYLILSAPRPREATTRLYDGNLLFRIFQDSIKESLFLVRGNNNPFASRFIDFIDGERIIRYNPAVMKPLNKSAEILAHYINEKWRWDVEINWRECHHAIIDNWRCLHSRSAVNDPLSRCGLWRFAMGDMK